MKVPNKILRTWRKELDSNDYGKIEGIHERTARRAVEEGRCLQETHDCINRYLTIKKYNEQEFISQFKA